MELRAEQIEGSTPLEIVCSAIPFVIFIVIFALGALVQTEERMELAAEQIEGSTALKIVWSAIPFVIFMLIFAWGAIVYFKERTPPAGATEVYIVAKQWMWKVEHAEGHREIG